LHSKKLEDQYELNKKELEKYINSVDNINSVYYYYYFLLIVVFLLNANFIVASSSSWKKKWNGNTSKPIQVLHLFFFLLF
jgi:hypothetical protein